MIYKGISWLLLAMFAFVLFAQVFVFRGNDSPPPILDGDTDDDVVIQPDVPSDSDELPDSDGDQTPEETPIIPPNDNTPFPEPAPTPPPIIEPEKPVQDIMLRSNTNGLNIRSGMGTGYSSLGSINKGDLVAFVTRCGDWYETVYREKKAYVFAQHVSQVVFDKSSAKVESAIEIGKKLLGIPYVYGAQRLHYGNGVLNSNFTGSSYDCSSYVQYIYYKAAKIILKSTSREQSLQGKYVASAKRGDLMFFTNASRAHLTGIDRIGHVAIYLGNNYIMHTASDYAVVEQISSTRWNYFISARQVF